MRTTGLEVVHRTHALVVGVGRFANDKYRSLDGCADGARRIADRLASPRGCRLPPENVTLLCEPHETTSRAISDALSQIAGQLGEHDALFLYFGSHGVNFPGGFGLACYDSDPAVDSFITSDRIVALLASVSFKGLTVVLDCCGGAEFVERSPTAFRELFSRTSYTVIWSATKARQSSWDVKGDGSYFTAALAEGLEGKFPTVGSKGEIFYDDLFDFVVDRTQELYKTRIPLVQRPNSVAFTVFTETPLLFVNSDSALSSVSLRTGRYSRGQLIKRAIQAAVMSFGLVALLVMSAWLWLDSSRYYRFEGNYLA